MTASRIIPPSNLPPESQPWGRDTQDSILRDAQDIESLKTNTLSAYQQLNISTGAAARQLAGVQNYLYRLPTSRGYNLTAPTAGVALPANTWVTMISERISIPRPRNAVTVAITANIDITMGTTNPNIWFEIYPGSGAVFQSPTSSFAQDDPGLTTYHRNASAATSATYAFGPLGGDVTVTLRLWCATAITMIGGQAMLSCDIITNGTL